MIPIGEVLEIVKQRYSGIVIKDSYRETAVFYNPDCVLKNGVYVCTIKESDGPNDKASLLNRDGVYRLSCGLDDDLYHSLFGAKPSRPSKGDVVDLPFDFSALNQIMPHPVYAWMNWICVNSPSKATMKKFMEFIDNSYNKAVKSYQVKIRKSKIGE